MSNKRQTSVTPASHESGWSEICSLKQMQISNDKQVPKIAVTVDPCDFQDLAVSGGTVACVTDTVTTNKTTIIYTEITAQQTQDVESMFVWRWSSVVDGGPTVNQHWFTVLCLLEGCEDPTTGFPIGPMSQVVIFSTKGCPVGIQNGGEGGRSCVIWPRVQKIKCPNIDIKSFSQPLLLAEKTKLKAKLFFKKR